MGCWHPLFGKKVQYNFNNFPCCWSDFSIMLFRFFNWYCLRIFDETLVTFRLRTDHWHPLSRLDCWRSLTPVSVCVEQECLSMWHWNVCLCGTGVSVNVELECLSVWNWSVCQCGTGMSVCVELECLLMWNWNVCLCGTGVSVNVELECLSVWNWSVC